MQCVAQSKYAATTAPKPSHPPTCILLLVPAAALLLVLGAGVCVAEPVAEAPVAVGVTFAPRSGSVVGYALLFVLLTLTNTQSASYRYGLITFVPVMLLYASLIRVS
jgi:hypothetical protein